MTTIIKRILIHSMSKRGVSDRMPKGPIRKIGAYVKEIKVGSLEITIERNIMFEMETTTTTTTSTAVTVVTEKIKWALCSVSKLGGCF